MLKQKRYLREQKNSYDSIVKENKQLECIINIKERFKQYQQQQQQQEFVREKEYFQQSPQKRYKKVVYEEETDSELEVEERQYVPEDEPIDQEEKEEQKQPQKRKKKIFNYLNKDAKRNKRVFLGQTISPFDDIGNSSAIDRAASN